MRGLRLGLSALRSTLSGRLGGVSLPNFFADSASGLDTNPGTLAAPFLSLTKLVDTVIANPTKKLMGLISGSSWRDALGRIPGSGLPVGSSVSSTGLVTVTGDNIITGWTAHATLADVWEKAGVANDGFGNDRLTIYKDGVLLTRVTTAALCSTTPNSFVDKKGSDGATWLLQINVGAAANPTSFTMTAAVRRYAIILDDNSTVTGPIRIQRVLNNNGSLEMGKNATASKVLAVDGTKHCALASSGTFTDVLAYQMDAVTSYELSATYFVAYSIDASNLSMKYVRCGAGKGTGPGQVGWISHDSLATSFYDLINFEQCWSYAIGTGMNPSAKTVTVKAFYTKDVTQPLAFYANDATIDYAVTNNTVSDNGLICLFSNLTTGGTKTITFTNCVFYMSGGNSVFFGFQNALNGFTIRFVNCVFYASAFQGGFIGTKATAWSSGALIVNNCIFAFPVVSNPIAVPAGVSYTGNNNVFLCSSNTLNTIYNNYQGTATTTLAGWQTATGQDANSLAYGPSSLAALFSGTVANGDFRLGATGAGAAAAAISAGPQLRWDWNARAAVAGAPQAWPVVPTTVAGAQTYITNPVMWTF